MEGGGEGCQDGSQHITSPSFIEFRNGTGVLLTTLMIDLSSLALFYYQNLPLKEHLR